MMSSTRQERIRQNTPMVWVLTLSFRFRRVICAGLTPCVWISAYWDTPFWRMVSHRCS